MPFKSEAQRGFMYTQHPKMAKEFEKHTPKGKKLPNKMPASHMKMSKKDHEDMMNGYRKKY